MNGRGNFSFKKRLRIYLRDAFTCRYCDRAMNPLSDDLSLDHVDPVGGDDDSNLVTSCISCNSRKGSRTPEAWRASAAAKPQGSNVNPSQVVVEVARKHGLTLARLTGPDRTAFLVVARAEAAYRLREECALSLKDIGRSLGGRDHSTIIHLLKKWRSVYPPVDAANQHGVGKDSVPSALALPDSDPSPAPALYP